MSLGRRKNMRKTFLVDRKVQVKYATFIVVLLFVYTLVLLLAILAPHAINLFSDSPLPEQVASAEAVLRLNGYIWPWIILFMIGSAVYSVFITHKIAGPVFAFNRFVRGMAQRDLSARVKLRDGDDLQDLAAGLNLMADSIEADLRELDEAARKLAAFHSELNKAVDAGNPSGEAVKGLLGAAELPARRMQEIAGKYRFREEG